MLTDEEKKRMGEEEAYRAEVQAGLEKPKTIEKGQAVNTLEDRQKQARRNSNYIAFWIIVAFIAVVLFFSR